MIDVCIKGHYYFTEFGCSVCKGDYVCRCCNKLVDFYGSNWCMIKSDVFHKVCLFDRLEKDYYDLSVLFDQSELIQSPSIIDRIKTLLLQLTQDI